MREIKTIEYMCGLSVMIVGLGLYSYYVRELLASLVLFTGTFLLLGLLALGVFLAWCGCAKVAIWARSASRSVIAYSRRLITAYTRP